MEENKGLSLSALSLADFQLPLRPGHGRESCFPHHFLMPVALGIAKHVSGVTHPWGMFRDSNFVPEETC